MVRIAGSNRLNPLPHAGTISVFLLGIVVVSGLYITLFFEFGHVASYSSVQSMEDHAIQRVVRALHRYSSAAMVLTTAVHGWKVFSAGRFSGRSRRWRWASGVSALLLVWLAGVTGYWLIWDVRAQALSEATIGLVSRFRWGAAISVNHLSGVGEGSGSGFLLVLWFLHLGLTAAIVWFTYRHLRRSKAGRLLSRRPGMLLGGALILVSLAMPLGMLEPASPERLVSDMPLDPFILFLLPPLLSDAPWLALSLGLGSFVLVMFLPRLVRSSDPAPIRIDEAACTGCELCVVDCPYNALAMSGTDIASPIAILDTAACVACGICLGSCAFGAIELPGATPRIPTEVDGRRVVVVCDRHLAHSELNADDSTAVMPVRCAGVFDPTAVRGLMEAGATGVQLVGCPPNDCRYGIGNQLASERIRGDRAPHPPRIYAESVYEDWVSPLELRSAVEHAGSHRSADGTTPPGGRSALIGGGLLVVLSAVIIAFATGAPFTSTQELGAVRVVVDHEAGSELEGDIGAAPDVIETVEISVDRIAQEVRTIPAAGPSSIGLVDWDLEPGLTNLEVVAVSGPERTVVFTGAVAITAGERFIVNVTDVAPPPGADEGRGVFNSRAAGCSVCHSTRPGDDGVGPSLAGVASVAGDRVEGLTAEQYLRQSILLPDQYIVEGWPTGQMLPIYRERLTEEELDSLIVYLLTLTTGPDS